MAKKTRLDERLEKEMQSRQMVELRKRNISRYFEEFAEPHRRWLKELTWRYMKRGVYKPSAWTLLPAYYKERDDKEIAVFAALLVKDGDGLLHRVARMREAMGEYPSGWFANRGFVALSLGDRQDGVTGGVLNWRLAKYFDVLWNESETFNFNLQALFKHCMKEYAIGLEKAIDMLVGDFILAGQESSKRMLSLVLSARDGVGQHLWAVDPSEVRCPLTSDVRTFLGRWIPNYRCMHDVDYTISLFGLDKDYHMLYACEAYNALKAIHPIECGVYERRFKSWYNYGKNPKPKLWSESLPPFDFTP